MRRADPLRSWRRAEALGGVLPVGHSLRVAGLDIEIVQSYADCTMTAVFCRSRPPAMISLWPEDPPELVASASSRTLDDLTIWRFPPVRPDRRSIRLSVEPGPVGNEGKPIAVPVDRTRTAGRHRFLAEPVAVVESPHARAQLIDLAAGMVRCRARLRVEATDHDVLALELGESGFQPHIRQGPGPAEFWREWHPPAGPEKVIRTADDEEIVEFSMAARATVGLRRMTPEEMADLPPPREPPPDYRAWALPGREPLASQDGGRSGIGDRPGVELALDFDAPPAESDAVELALEQLWAYRFGGARATVPPPRPDRAVSLAGIELEAAGCRVELTGWERADRGDFRLAARVDPPDHWPDLRVIADGASAGMWSSPPEDGVFSAALPMAFARLFHSPTVQIALRTVARRLAPIRLTAPLTPIGKR